MPSYPIASALFSLLLLASSGVSSAQKTASGTAPVFPGATDIGHTLPGTTHPGPYPFSLVITGGGSDLWGAHDDFHFDWIRISGDATLTAAVEFAPGAAALSKALLMFRQNLSPESPYADIAIHGDGHVTLQYRSAAAEPTRDFTANGKNPARIQIARKGNLFTASTIAEDGTRTVFATELVPLRGEVYLGLGVCAHNPTGLVSATFSNINLVRSAK